MTAEGTETLVFVPFYLSGRMGIPLRRSVMTHHL